MRPRLVEVRWRDAASTRYKLDAGLVTRRSVGWLVKRDGRELRLATTRDGRRLFEDYLSIPAPNVRSIRRLR